MATLFDATHPPPTPTRGPRLNDDGISVAGCSIIYAPRGQAGEYAPLSTNPYRGCGHGCAYCLSPDTLIQKADGSSVPLSDIQVGDDIVGIIRSDDTCPTSRYQYAKSKVLAKLDSVKPAYRITLDNGQSSVCSADHRWLTERGWKYTDRLTTNNEIRILGTATQTPQETIPYRRGYLAGVIRGDGTLKRYDYSGRYRRTIKKSPQKTDIQHHFRLAMKDNESLDRATDFLKSFHVPVNRFDFQHGGGPMAAIRNHSIAAFEIITDLIQFNTDSEWQRGFLAGIFDAEGGTTSGVIRIYNKDTELLTMIDRAMATFGFRVIRDAENENGCTAVRVLGGMSEVTRFFNLTAPAITRKFPLIGIAARGASRIVAIEPLGLTIAMLDITTSTENFIANGMISHNCYVPDVLRMTRKEFDSGAFPRPNFLDKLKADARKYQALGLTGQVMFSFTTDVYNPFDRSLTRPSIEVLREHGLGFCVLTKGGSRALADIDLYRPDRDAFASTLTSLDDKVSKKWERDAALPGDRIATLKAFHDRGIFTWVSLEPTLDCDTSIEIVRETHKFVDLYKIGRVNYLPMTKTTDWNSYTLRMIGTLNELGARHYIKRDLQKYLPPGYPNPLRVPQHH
jgi:DNA repair photolyase